MNSLLVLAALGIAAMAYLNNQDLKEEIENNNEKMDEEIKYLNDKIDDGVVTPDKIIAGIEVQSVMIGFSSISDKYMNCAAGIVWKNNNDEDVNLRVDSCTFSVGGYQMCVGGTNLPTIKIPKKGTIYQDLFQYENRVLFGSEDERKQFRVVIGDAQGHPGKEGRAVWGKANFDVVFNATFTPMGTLSQKGGKQGYVTNYDGLGRYYGSTALASNLRSWVRSYIGG